jgi:carbamoyl-phosphate synthase small subunit
VREYNDLPSNFRYTKTLSEVLEEHNIPAISGVDTRKITRILRDEGAQKVLITNPETPLSEAMEKLKAYQHPTDMVARVSCKKRWFSRTANHKYDIVAIDCGIKYNIIRLMNQRDCNVTIVPYNTTAEEILAFNPDGVFLSNGPGNPTHIPPVVETIQKLRGKVPIFGICLGLQVIALAYGAESYKMKFGHRGGNHPVKDLKTNKIHITSQNHSYAIDVNSLKNTDLEVTHINILDNTTEGVESKKDKVFALQFHPESAPGPNDSVYLFDRFIEMIEK